MKEAKEKSENKQEKHAELQLLMQHFQQMYQQFQMMEQHMMELINLNDQLGEISKTKIGSKVLIPLGAGIYLNGELKDNKEIFMNVGSKTTVKKSLKDAEELVKQQIENLKGHVENVGRELGSVQERILALQNETSD